MDDDNGRLEFEQRQGRISDEGLNWYRDRLADPNFARDFPTEHATLKASVDRAVAASGQSLDTAPDPRSTAQQVHDARFGVAYSDGKPQLPRDLASAIERDGGEHDPHDVAFALSNVGRSYKADYEAAARLLAQVGSKVEASKLSAATLANLAIFSDHLVRHAAGRPK
jgi:hypothetical protein